MWILGSTWNETIAPTKSLCQGKKDYSLLLLGVIRHNFQLRGNSNLVSIVSWNGPWFQLFSHVHYKLSIITSGHLPAFDERSFLHLLTKIALWLNKLIFKGVLIKLFILWKNSQTSQTKKQKTKESILALFQMEKEERN